MVRFRTPISLVAAMLAIALVAGILIGTQLLRGWNAQHGISPAGGVPPGVAQLEARPLTLPTLAAGAQCPVHLGSNTRGFDYGDGPVYAMGSDAPTPTNWGNYWDVEWFVDITVKGPVLVRGRDLRSNASVVFVGNHSAGRIVGTDSSLGHAFDQREELVLDPAINADVMAGGAPGWKVRQGMFAAWTGCVGFQIDGEGFSEKIIDFDGSAGGQ